MRPKRSKDLESFVLETLPEHPKDVVRVTAEALGVSRQAVHRVLARLVREDRVVASGQTRGREYVLGPVGRHTAELEVGPDLDEHRVWAEEVQPWLMGLPENVLRICEYGVTEMLNNVTDHSESSGALVRVDRTPVLLKVGVYDFGVGIFNKIRRACNLPTVNDAILELTKGKLTTDPSRHTGEGVFFSSKMFDKFIILSSDRFLSCQADGGSWVLESGDSTEGTSVVMEISPNASRTMKEVFDRYSSVERNYTFDRTHLVVRLVEPEGNTLVSRSQAKRILARLEMFREVMLDFEGVDSIGPAFADEVFRVFAANHPEVQLEWVNANDQVNQMIERARNTRGAGDKPQGS